VIRPTYQFNESSQDTVPQAFAAFLESTDFEDAIRNAISLGGDSDTLACITGGIAEAFYGGVPEDISVKVLDLLDDSLRGVTVEFRKAFAFK
jgi:ADP-ribosylglycohydrolase